MNPTRDDLLDLILRWEDAQSRGEALSPSDLCRDCPDLLPQLRTELAKLGQVNWLNEPLADATPSGAEPSAPSPSASLIPPILADRYRLDAIAGEGGFGRVYKGHDTWLERDVAIKIPKGALTLSGSDVDQCRLEARKVARLQHSHIVPVYDVGKAGATCFIISQWIDGMNLAAAVARGRLPLSRTVAIVAEVAEALDHAHRHGFIHRDIKPANILIDGAGQAYLTDFGIALIDEPPQSATGATGTLAYMAPEQVSDQFGPMDHRTDVYALGVVLYELLTGRQPFVAASPVDVRSQIVSATPQPPRALDPSIPESIAEICLRCLAKHPRDRFPSADDLAAALRTYAKTGSNTL